MKIIAPLTLDEHPDARGFFTRYHIILPHLNANLMLAGRDSIWCRCRAGDSAAVAVEAAAVWGSSWVVEAAALDLEAADEAVGAAAVWVNGWVVETAAAAAAAAATAAAATAAAE